jgi:hypothetical protein
MVETSKGRLSSFPAGMQMVYGVGIGDALAAVAAGHASPDDLVPLREHASAIVSAQGDLVAALKELDAEIAKRAPATKATPAAVASERFVAEIGGVALPDKVKDEIEHAIQKAVATQLAKIDTGGDLIEAPLSKIASFGAGIGARIRGRYLVNKNINLG